jgi:6-phosphogluconolactonase/glucosamine-6-phosphate isomerase/deaminase
LPLTILDETRSIDVIAFSFIAEELVERSAYLTSQNMKVDAYNHVVALNTTVEKKTFSIGMSGGSTTNFTIKYVIKKSFNVDT